MSNACDAGYELLPTFDVIPKPRHLAILEDITPGDRDFLHVFESRIVDFLLLVIHVPDALLELLVLVDLALLIFGDIHIVVRTRFASSSVGR